MEPRLNLTPRFSPRMPERVFIGPHDVPSLFIAPDAPGRFPAVVMQHGLGSHKDDLLPAALLLAAFGFVALLPDAWGHGEHPLRATVDMGASPTDYVVEVTRETTRTLHEAVAFLAWRPEARQDAIVLGGFSLGAMASLIAGIQNPLAAGVVSIAGSPLPDLVREGATAWAMPSDAACRWAVRHDAASQVGRLAPRPLLISHGRQDDMVPVAGALRLYEAAKPHYTSHPERLALMLYEHTHTVTPEQLGDIIQWMAPLFLDEASPVLDEAAS